MDTVIQDLKFVFRSVARRPSLLFGVGTAEPATMVSVSAILVAVATFATYVPAARATRVDPATVLREE